MSQREVLGVTGATGQLGQLVIEKLLETVSPERLVAIVRSRAKADELALRGVTIREADYDDPAALRKAVAGVDRLLLISSSELGHREAQHRNVLRAASDAGIGLLVYTSLLHADSSPLSLAPEHLATEQAIREAALPFAILRNGWYAENYTGFANLAVNRGVFTGSAGDGRLSLAARADYAEAAAAALQGAIAPGSTVELAGDEAVTLEELAAEISEQSGKTISYRNVSRDEHAASLEEIGLPEPLAQGLADWDVSASLGALFDDGRELSRLIGRPTTPLSQLVRNALEA